MVVFMGPAKGHLGKCICPSVCLSMYLSVGIALTGTTCIFLLLGIVLSSTRRERRSKYLNYVARNNFSTLSHIIHKTHTDAFL